MSAEHNTRVIYRVKAACHIGGLRGPGEVFRWERFDPCPKHLEEVDDGSCRPDASPNGDNAGEAGPKGQDRPRKAPPSPPGGGMRRLQADGVGQSAPARDVPGPTLEDITAGTMPAATAKALKTKTK